MSRKASDLEIPARPSHSLLSSERSSGAASPSENRFTAARSAQDFELRRELEASGSIHWLQTLIAKGNRALRREHLRFRPKDPGAPALHCLLVDCSHSMLAGRRLALAKGLLRQLIQMCYEQRAEVAIVGFAGDAAKVHLTPLRAKPLTSRHVEQWLRPIRGGGATPFTAGVRAASSLLARAAFSHSQQDRWLWLLTDGRTLEAPGRPPHAHHVVVVDCDGRRLQLGGCRALASRWDAHYQLLKDFALPRKLEDLS